MTIPTTVLLILDGFGSNQETTGNAILSTPTPHLDYLWNHYPHTLLKAAEEEVGLNFGEMGNSEVGHLTIGSGRVLYQSLPRINAAIQDGSFYSNPAFLAAINHVKQHQSALHLIGMVSVAGVHAHLNHLIALIELASKHKLPKVFIHVTLDGRDSGPRDAPIFLAKIQEAIEKYKTGSIATISGRAYTMDRNQNWERIVLAANALLGLSGPTSQDPLQVIQRNYKAGSDDENQLPTIIVDAQGRPIGPFSPNDALIFTNFREDRARQITQYLTQTAPAPQAQIPTNLKIVTMYEYQSGLPVTVAFPPEQPPNTLSDIMQHLGIRQTYISETEKYAHVTYFFNGRRQTKHPLENYIHIHSPKPETFVREPQMAAPQILQKTLETIAAGGSQFIVVNFANPDMLGHTGNFQATRIAVSLIDTYVGQIWQAVSAQQGHLFLTADHGNCESMIDPATGQITKDHTSTPVPFIAAGPGLQLAKLENNRVTLGAPVTGLLTDVAPTLLTLLRLPIPEDMTGTPLFTAS